MVKTWREFAIEAPELAAAVRGRFEATKHHVLATLRRDGSPRVSGTEAAFTEEDLTIGSMGGAVKALDLQRDGRFALHANPGDGSMTEGDAKVAGRAEEVPTPGEAHSFRLLLEEVVLTSVAPTRDGLIIDTWHAERGLRQIRRS